MHKMRVRSDDYLNHKKEINRMEEMMGVEAKPIDLQGRFVPVKKNDPDNLIEMQEDISERFDIES